MKKKSNFKGFIRKVEGKTLYPEGLVTIRELYEKHGLKEGGTFYWCSPFLTKPISYTFKLEYFLSESYSTDPYATTDPDCRP